ncbi:hypothetical protein HYQ46_009401 [Verticillium longisporum]|nr:hypothetical protein HYQ44_001330 [Verticillium longisporum]KAG7132997.1 hypothetical protein HYQ46_009401 [Verticillium longisporum]
MHNASLLPVEALLPARMDDSFEDLLVKSQGSRAHAFREKASLEGFRGNASSLYIKLEQTSSSTAGAHGSRGGQEASQATG